MHKTTIACVLLAYSIACSAFGKNYTEKMQFTVFTPCMGNASFCRPRLLASGSIDEDADDKLRRILASPDHPMTIVFDSPGGHLATGLQMGRLIRENAMSTVVANAYSEEQTVESGGSQEIVLATDVGCYSACAYAFMGGVSRSIEEGGRLGVHQFKGTDVDAESAAQSITAVISHYMESMGVSRKLLDVASTTTADDMFLIQPPYAQIFNLDNQEPALAEWQLKATVSGDLVLVVDQQKHGSDGSSALAFIRSRGSPYVTAMVLQRGIDTAVLKEMASTMEGQQTTPKLCASVEACVDLDSTGPWRYNRTDETLSSFFSIPIERVSFIFSRAKSLSLDAGFPNMYFNEAPSVELGVVGLQNGFAALVR